MSLLTLLFSLIPAALSQAVIPLSDFAWTLSNAGLNISVPASFPSQAHLDLYNVQLIPDPYYGLNDFNLRWVARNTWTYSASLQGLDRGAPSTWLLFQGLDTFAGIRLCNQPVSLTNNQFRQYFFDVTSFLKDCDSDKPLLEIEFASAPETVDRIVSQPGQETWPDGVELVFEFPNRQFMRKEQSDFGWDWAPAFAPAGPWLPAYVVQVEQGGIHATNTLVDVYRQGQRNNQLPSQEQPWVLNCSVDYLGTMPSNVSMRYTLKSNNGSEVASGDLSNVTTTSRSITGMTIIKNGVFELWWPHGLGPQNLYNLTLEVSDGKGSMPLATIQRRIGFRTIVLNEEPISDQQLALGIAPGANWHFEVNGHEFFAKGSNFVPPDTFWPRVTEERIRNLFGDVVAANQNMLRVWASGAYSPDFLYDVADELGILLWSEFEFGDSLYPVDQAFLDNVYEEAVYQVRRVNHHASLAFWAGGNELENLELILVNGTAMDEYVRYKDEYERLFLTTIFPAVFENSRSISYAPSSTSNGFSSLNFTDAPYMQERYYDLEPGSVYGETGKPIDYYNYDPTIAFNFSAYPVGRFSNEFGFHSMPSLQTWQQAISPADLHFNSSVIQLRNHHYPAGNLTTSPTASSAKGMFELTYASQLWFPTPSKHDSTANFSAWCHTTQLFQAAYYVNQIAFYRRGAGLPQRTLGSLYWQLNDIWQAPTWAGIEYDGRWKVLHYRARDAYSDVTVYPFFQAGNSSLEVWVMSDLWEPVDASVDMAWYDWTGQYLSAAKGLQGQAVTVGAINATRVFEGNVTAVLGALEPRDVVLRVNVTAKGRLPNSAATTTFTHQSWMAATSLSQARLMDPGLTLSYDGKGDVFVVEATAGVAAWVWLDYPSGAVLSFADNGFWLGKGEARRIGYTVRMDGTGGRWREGVTVQSLWNNTLAE